MDKRNAGDRALSWVVITETCWLWTGTTNANGYGTISDKHTSFLAHRWLWMLLRGEIRDGLQLDHLCRVRNCVNPSHLEPVTNRENCLRGESPAIRIYRSGFCMRGHRRTPENRRGGVCRPCYADWRRANPGRTSEERARRRAAAGAR